jgi:hypothetical protein
MVDKLTDTLVLQQRANEEIIKKTDTLKEKNVELEKMNALMVGRELKMIELKNQLTNLKNIGEKTTPTPSQ